MLPRTAVAQNPPSASSSRLGRLRKRSEFLRVAAKGRKASTPGVVLQALAIDPTIPMSEPAELRVGFTVSRKVGNSVARNRARRRLREAARSVLPRLAAPAHDYVLIGRTETLTRPYPALLADVESALRRVGAHRDETRKPGAARGDAR